MNHRMVRLPDTIRRAGAVNVPPVGTFHAAPPFASDNTIGRAGLPRHIGPEYKGPAPPFCLADMACGLDEGGEFGVGDGCRAHQEGLHPDTSHRPLAVIGYLGPPGADKGPSARNLHGVIRHLPRSGDRRRHHHGSGCGGQIIRRAATSLVFFDHLSRTPFRTR